MTYLQMTTRAERKRKDKMVKVVIVVHDYLGYLEIINTIITQRF
jgi:hypothetical protein